MKFIIKHFGKTSTILFLGLMLIVNTFGANLSDLEIYRNINIYLGWGIVLLFYILLYSSSYRWIQAYRIGFIVLLYHVQALLVSKIIHYIEINNAESDMSMVDRNAAIGMSWIIIIPSVLIVFLLSGWGFDYMSSKKQKNSLNKD